VQGTSRLACARQVQSKAGEGLAWVRRQIECTQLQFWGSARANTAWSWCLRLQTQWGSSKVREMSRHETQQKSTPMKCEAVVAVLASEGLALVSVSRQNSKFFFVLIGKEILFFPPPFLPRFFSNYINSRQYFQVIWPSPGTLSPDPPPGRADITPQTPRTSRRSGC